MNIWLAYVNYPITTAVYLNRALRQAGHQVITIGPRLPEEMIKLWDLRNMHLPLDTLEIDTSFTPDMAAILVETPPDQLPDLYLWVESVNGYKPQNLDKLPCPKACWLIDTHYHLTAALETTQQFDYVFIAQLVDLAAFRAKHPRVYWLPLACDPEIHACQQVEKKYEIGFVGSMNQRREEMLDYLGKQFNVHRERSFWTDMARTFSASKIVLNDASFDDLNMRFFEALASGSLLLSNPTSGSGQDILFHDGIEYACHHDHDLEEVVRRYLTDEQLRERVASEGKKRVLAAHTYRHRAEDLVHVVTGKKPDTFSPEELRSRSVRTAARIPGMKPGPPPRIRTIISTRYCSNWPTWQMVHEWEDILAKILTVPFRPIGETCMLPDPNCLPGNFDLIFLQLAGELHYYARNPQLLPIVMDLWRDDFTDFIRHAPSFPLVFVTSLQAFQELSHRLPNLRYLPFSLADQYFKSPLPDKDIDIIQYGRRNPLLDQYMERFLKRYPSIHYVTTEAYGDEKVVRIYSNQQGCLGESDSRTTFMGLLKRSRISLVSTVGMDGSRNTGGIDPVSPRFLESMAAGCHLVGRIPPNEEFAATGVGKWCHHVQSYDQFEQLVLGLLAAASLPDYRPFLKDRLTSSLPSRILQELHSLSGAGRKPPATEEFMQNARIESDLVKRMEAIRQIAGEVSPAVAFTNYHTLCDVIACYREFHQRDLSHHYTTIMQDQTESDALLLIVALELAGAGQVAAALALSSRAMQLNLSSHQAAFLHADLLRRTGALDEARLACLEMQKTWPGFGEAQAVIDMCAVDEALPVPKEHYHLLHAAHCLLQPRRYLEVGISNGKSLSLAQCGSSAIGVDPITACEDQLCFHSPEVMPVLFKLTSNDFFQQGCMQQVWGDQPFDMAFIDGLHLFEQALMDFIHLEQRATPDSVIFIHDCLPVSIAGAERMRNTMVWTGDVWKVILCLKTVRPDLEIITFPVRPSGLAMVRRLDNSSKLLSTQFDTIVAHFIDARLPEDMSERFRLLNVTEQPFEELLSAIPPFQQPLNRGGIPA